MSKEERFLNPKVLARMVETVEWEGNLVLYKNGSSNQGEFMRALGLLYGQWLFQEDLPDAWAAAKAIGARDWFEMFRLLLRKLPEQIEQMGGFWRGTLSGGLPKAKGLFGGLNPWTGEGGTELPSEDRMMASELEYLFTRLASIVEGVRNG